MAGADSKWPTDPFHTSLKKLLLLKEAKGWPLSTVCCHREEILRMIKVQLQQLKLDDLPKVIPEDFQRFAIYHKKLLFTIDFSNEKIEELCDEYFVMAYRCADLVYEHSRNIQSCPAMLAIKKALGKENEKICCFKDVFEHLAHKLEVMEQMRVKRGIEC